MDQKLQSHGRRASNEDRLQEKIHTVSSQISGMDLCFNIQLQESILGDVEINMNDDSRGAVGQQGNQQGDLFLPPIVQVDFPKFDGSNSTSWFLRCNNYFKLVPNIPDAHKIKMACLNLEGRAAAWYKGSRMGQTELSWSQFVAIILARFESIKGAKILVELSKLKHTDSYDDYVDKFEELKDRLVLLNQGRYTEDHFIASFISGVCKDMQVAINLVEPTTLRQTIEFGREHLLSTQEITRKLKPSVNVEQNKQTEMEDLSLEFSDVSKIPTEFPPSKRSEHRIIFKPNRGLNINFCTELHTITRVKLREYLRKILKWFILRRCSILLTERSFDPGGRHVFVVVFQPEMQVMCVAELVKTKLKIGVEGKAVDEKLIDRLIAVEHHWIYQDLGKLVSVNLSSRDKSALIDEFKVLDIMQVQEFEISIKQWGMMYFDFCSGGFESKIGANFISLRPLPKPPPMSKFYNGDSVVLKRREESVNQTSKLVPLVKVETEERKMLSVLQFGMTFLCTEKKTDKEYACKYIAKRKLLTQEDVDDVRREVELLQHLFDNPSVVWIKGAYEDVVAVHVIIKLYARGEFFDRIVKWGHYSEEDIAGLKGMFKMIATYNSEYITFKELKAGLKRIGANHNESETYDLRKVADVDSNETIDYGEFVATAHALHLNKIEKEDHMFKAFSYFDKDENQYNFYLGGGTFDVSLFTIEEGILEVNNLLLLVVVEIIRCIWLDKMFDQPPPKPPYQFQHWSLGDNTHSRGEYCHALGWSAIWGFTSTSYSILRNRIFT